MAVSSPVKVTNVKTGTTTYASTSGQRFSTEAAARAANERLANPPKSIAQQYADASTRTFLSHNLGVPVTPSNVQAAYEASGGGTIAGTAKSYQGSAIEPDVFTEQPLSPAPQAVPESSFKQGIERTAQQLKSTESQLSAESKALGSRAEQLNRESQIAMALQRGQLFQGLTAQSYVPKVQSSLEAYNKDVAGYQERASQFQADVEASRKSPYTLMVGERIISSGDTGLKLKVNTGKIIDQNYLNALESGIVYEKQRVYPLVTESQATFLSGIPETPSFFPTVKRLGIPLASEEQYKSYYGEFAGARISYVAGAVAGAFETPRDIELFASGIKNKPLESFASIPEGLFETGKQLLGYEGAFKSGKMGGGLLTQFYIGKALTPPATRITSNVYNLSLQKFEGLSQRFADLGREVPLVSYDLSGKGKSIGLVQDIHKNPIAGDLPLKELSKQGKEGAFVTRIFPEVPAIRNLDIGETALAVQSPTSIHWGLPVRGQTYFQPFQEFYLGARQFGSSAFQKAGSIYENIELSLLPKSSKTYVLISENKTLFDNFGLGKNEIMLSDTSVGKAKAVLKSSEPKFGGKYNIPVENVLKIAEERQVALQSQGVLPSGQKVAGSTLKITGQLPDLLFYDVLEAPFGLGKYKTIQSIYEKTGLGREWKNATVLEVSPARPRGRPPIIREVAKRERPTAIIEQEGKFLLVEERTGQLGLLGGGRDYIFNPEYYVGSKIKMRGGRWIPEDLQAGLSREALEEIGYSVTDLKTARIGIVKSNPYVSSQGYTQQDVFKVFTGKATKVSDVAEGLKSGEIKSIRFLSKEEILSKPAGEFTSGTKEIMERYFGTKPKSKELVEALPEKPSKISLKAIEDYRKAYSPIKYEAVVTPERSLTGLTLGYEKYLKPISFKEYAYGGKSNVRVEKVVSLPRREKYSVSLAKEELSLPALNEYAPKAVSYSAEVPLVEKYAGTKYEAPNVYKTLENIEVPKVYEGRKIVTYKGTSFYKLPNAYKYSGTYNPPEPYGNYKPKEIIVPNVTTTKVIWGKAKPKKKASGISRAFDVFLRESLPKGKSRVKPYKIASGLPRQLAVKVGLEAADVKTARTAIIVPAGTTSQQDIEGVSSSLLAKFRTPKGVSKIRPREPLTFVEKSKFAISSKLEKIGIPEKAAQMRRSGLFAKRRRK